MRFSGLFLACLLFVTSVRAQVTPNRVTPDRVTPDRVRNVRVRAADSTHLEIRYDLLSVQPGDSAYFTVRSRLRGALQIRPEFVQGDFGNRITAGPDRRILWNAVANGYRLNEEIKVAVVIKTGTAVGTPTVAERPTTTTPPGSVTAQPPATTPAVATRPDAPSPTPPTTAPQRREPVAVVPNTVRSQPNRPPVAAQQSQPINPPVTSPGSTAPEPLVQRTRYAGPAWALLSVVAPGIGNIFVQKPRQIGLRPFVFVGCYGLLVYGLLERRQSQTDYARYTEQKNVAAGEPYYKTANEHYHRYYLTTRTAAVVAATDVLLTFVRGLRNNRATRQAVMVRPGLQAGQPTAVVRYSF